MELKGLQHLINRYSLDLRRREGKDRWGEPISIDGLKLIDHNERLQAIVVKKNDNFYLVTPFGTFYVDCFITSVFNALKCTFGLTGRQVRSPGSLKREIEQQLELREKAKEILGDIRSGRYIDVDPRYGVIIDDKLYTAQDPEVYISLPPELRTIPKLLFAIYGREIPEHPNLVADIINPPRTIPRSGGVIPTYLLDEDEELDLYVYFQGRYISHSYGKVRHINLQTKKRFFIGHGKKTYEITGELKKADIASAFQAAFGVPLPPRSTREDVEAIIALRAIGS